MWRGRQRCHGSLIDPDYLKNQLFEKSKFPYFPTFHKYKFVSLILFYTQLFVYFKSSGYDKLDRNLSLWNLAFPFLAVVSKFPFVPLTYSCIIYFNQFICSTLFLNTCLVNDLRIIFRTQGGSIKGNCSWWWRIQSRRRVRQYWVYWTTIWRPNGRSQTKSTIFRKRNLLKRFSCTSYGRLHRCWWQVDVGDFILVTIFGM